MMKRLASWACITMALLLCGCSGEPDTTVNFTPTVAAQAITSPIAALTPLPTIEMTLSPTPRPTPTVPPEPAKAEMPEGMVAIGQCELKLRDYSPVGFSNLKLASQQLDSIMLEPGQRFSIYRALLGKGIEYKKEIMDFIDPKDINPLPPGILPVSTGLLNAALLADLEIVERHQGKWPVNYALRGLEAIVDIEGEKDLVIRNSHDFPVWIKTDADNKSGKFRVSIFGKQWPGKHPVKLFSKSEKTKPAPPELPVEDKSLRKGETIRKPSIPGIKATVIRQWLDPQTKKTRDEVLYEVEYEPYAGTIYYPPGEKPKEK